MMELVTIFLFVAAVFSLFMFILHTGYMSCLWGDRDDIKQKVTTVKPDESHLVHMGIINNHLNEIPGGALYVSPQGTHVVRERRKT